MNQDCLLSPDGQRYFLMAEGRPQAMPYHLRWFLPKVLGKDFERWRLWTQVALATICWALVLYAWQRGVPLPQAILAGVLLAGLPSVWMYWLKLPVLTDMASMAIALLAAVVPTPWGVLLALLGGCIREGTPVYAALYAWNPWLLLGLAAPAVRFLFWKHGIEADPRVKALLDNPVKTSWARNGGRWKDLRISLLPWAGLLAAVFHPSCQLLVSYAVCCAPIFRSHDFVRHYIMAAPVLILAVVQLPLWFLIPITAAHFALPWHRWVRLA